LTFTIMYSSSRVARQFLFGLLVYGSLWSVVAHSAQRGDAYRAALESITAADLKQHVEQLTADAMEGREAGTRGGRAAAEYLVDHWKRIHIAGAADGGGYFQAFAPNFRNVLALLPGGDPSLSNQIILVGAHYDHVGYGTARNSYGPTGHIHPGADDDASGTSAVLEIAKAFTLLSDPPKRPILFVCFDAEEKGALGSKHFAAYPTVPLAQIAVMLDLDMIGRLREEHLTVYGTRSGYGLHRLLCEENADSGLTLDCPWDLTKEADHYAFFARGIPVLLFHTGLHKEYHTPRDTAKTLDDEGLRRVTRFVFSLVCELADRPETSHFRAKAREESEKTRKQAILGDNKPINRLGVAWQPAEPSVEGVRLTRIFSDSAAERANIHVNDRIIRFAGEDVHCGEDLAQAVRAAANPAQVVILRPDQKEPMEITVQLAGKPMRLGIQYRVDDAEPGTVAITYVAPGSLAARAGLQVGDSIYQIGGRHFTAETEFGALVNSLPDPIELQTQRDGRIRTVILTKDR
jgi:hypothetical protein